MKQLKSLFHSVLGAVIMLSLIAATACTSEEPIMKDVNQDNSQTHVCELLLNISKAGFPDEPETRSAAAWEEGDKIYLLFDVDSLTTWGNAQYSGGKWKLNYEGQLKADSLSVCRAVYLEHAGEESGMVIALSDSTAIYEDLNGSYLLSGDTLSVTASLKPKTGRMRFKGKDKAEVKVYGISHYTSYDYFKGTYTTSIATITTKVKTDYTPYIYGEFADKEEPRLNVYNANEGFTRIFPTTIFNAGESGYMSIPTSDTHEGWTKNVTLKVNGVEFTMITVAYTSGNFLLAETETTEALYSAVMQDDSDATNFPKTNLGTDDWNKFLTKIGNIMSLNLRLPKVAEWKYAYKGGAESKGYKYSGSDVIGDVAWYKGNSDGKKHEVKSLKPNELGLYDMSGNVEEIMNETYYNSCDHYWYGGSFKDAANDGSSYSYYGDSSNPEGGLRIALTY